MVTRATILRAGVETEGMPYPRIPLDFMVIREVGMVGIGGMYCDICEKKMSHGYTIIFIRYRQVPFIWRGWIEGHASCLRKMKKEHRLFEYKKPQKRGYVLSD
jgi:hypothetical protein